MFDLFAENARLGEENDRLTRRLNQREEQLEEVIYNLSQETAEKERLKQENTRLQGKLTRMKQSIAGQEHQWLQTKVGLLSKIAYLQEVNDDYRDKIDSLTQEVNDAARYLDPNQ